MKVIFVCTANMCRSPMAEHWFRKMIVERGVAGIEVESAGVLAWPGAAASEGMRQEAADRGLDLSAHRSRRFDPAAVGPGDLILVMEQAHLRRLIDECHVAPENVRLLGAFDPEGPQEVEDPVAGEVSYRDAADRIGVCLERLLGWIEGR